MVPFYKSLIATPGPNQVVKDLLVFNHDVWPTAQSELIDFAQEAIMRLSTWFQPALEDKGCIIAAILPSGHLSRC